MNPSDVLVGLVGTCHQSQHRLTEAAGQSPPGPVRRLLAELAAERDQFARELAARVHPPIGRVEGHWTRPATLRSVPAWVILTVTRQEEERVRAAYGQALARADWPAPVRAVLERQLSWVELGLQRLDWHQRQQEQRGKFSQSKSGPEPTVAAGAAPPWWGERSTKRSPPMNDLKELFVSELKDIYDAEKQIVKSLPKMAKAAESEELRTAFEEHIEVSKQQISRLEEVFTELGIAAKGKKCQGIQGILEEGKELLDQDVNPSTLDAGLIAAAQKVEHYEIATYGTLCAWAQQLGLDKAADLLEQTLEEEKETDENLTQLAENVINQEASQGGEEEGDEREAA